MVTRCCFTKLLLFFRGESAIHLASGAQGSHGDIRHVELLLRHGSNLRRERTNEGCTASHYAAESGTKEVKKPLQYLTFIYEPFKALQLLLDANCPLTKATMNKEYR